jgi:hypothetical protein
MTEFFTVDTFSDHVNTRFLMHYGDAQSAELELLSVTDVGSSAQQAQFSLVFLGPNEAPIGQGTYRIVHDKLGALDLFLVPIGMDKTGVRYEAIFNRVFE